MASTTKFPLRAWLLFTTLPALVIGGALWLLADAVPGCSVTEHQRLPAPDGKFDLVTFSRACGEDTPANTQAALLPPDDAIPDDVVSFLSVGATTDFAARWIAADALEMTLPADAHLYRHDDAVAGVTVTYR